MSTILLIEDNEPIRALLTRRLEIAGYQVIDAEDGAQGLMLAWSSHPDLILLDMSMPVFNGWDTARQLKASAETRTIPIIAVTARSLPGDRERCLDVGCDEYEAKPIQWDRLLTKIRALVPASNPSAHP